MFVIKNVRTSFVYVLLIKLNLGFITNGKKKYK